MGVLTKSEIERRLQKGQLIRNARTRADGSFDIEPDSYDLTAGIAIWNLRDGNGKSTIVTYPQNTQIPVDEPPTISVLPGQMLFVITREDVVIPEDLSATVYSRNNLALKGILALNAGHVDPGYDGPIVIRLINLRATTWPLTIGDPIFTIVFQTLDVNKGDVLEKHVPYPRNEMISRVQDTASYSLSNALFDLYIEEIEHRLNRYYVGAQQNLLNDLTRHFEDKFVPHDRVWQNLFKSAISKITGFALLAAAIIASLYYLEIIPWW